MTSWVVTIDAQHPEHWKIAKAHGFWDMTKFRKVAFGDLVYFWQAGGSLLAQCQVTQGSFPISPTHPTPWEDSGKRPYVARFHFDVLSEAPVEQPSWSELQSPMEKKMSPQFFPKFTSEGDEARLADFFHGIPGVQVEYGEDGFASELAALGDQRTFDLRAIHRRQGQQAFRNELIAAYGGCAVTGTTAIDVLEAAHIHPYKGAHTNHVTNGLLLRSDIHTLFDLHRLTVTPDLVVKVHPDLLGGDYGHLDGQPLVLVPSASKARPNRQLLGEHHARCEWTTALDVPSF